MKLLNLLTVSVSWIAILFAALFAYPFGAFADVKVQLVKTIEYNPPPKLIPGDEDKAGGWHKEDYGTVEAFDFSPETNLLAAVVEKHSFPYPSYLVILDLKNDKVLHRIEFTRIRNSSPWGISVSPDGTMVALPEGKENRVSIYNLVTGKRVASGKTDGRANYTSWNPDGSSIAVVNGKEVELWSLEPFKRIKFIPGARARDNTEWVMAAEWSPDGKFLAIGTNNPSVYISEPDKGRQSPSLTPLQGTAYRVVWSPSGNLLAVDGFGTGSAMNVFADPASKVLDPFNPKTKHLKKLKAPGNRYWTSVAWSPKGELLAYTDNSSRLFIRDINTDKLVERFTPRPKHSISDMQWRGDKLITVGNDKKFSVWKLSENGNDSSATGSGSCAISGKVFGSGVNSASIFSISLYGPDNKTIPRATKHFSNALNYEFSNLPNGRYWLTVDTKADTPIGPHPPERLVQCAGTEIKNINFELR
jgi:WD40 repeat protein